MSAVRREFFARILRALKDGTLELPSLPDIALEVRSVTLERDLALNELVQVIQQDPGLSAYLIKIGNSAQYNRGRVVSSLTTALTRLGIDATRDLTASYAIRTLFFLKEPTIKGHLRAVWQRSVHTAAMAHVMAPRCGFPTEKALLAGLMQDIGALPILAQLQHFPDLAADSASVQELLQQFAGKVSGLILNAWGFEPAMVVVGLDREAWLRDRQPAPELADLILVARYHTYIGQPGFKALPPLSDMPAFAKLDLGALGPEQGLLFLKEAKAELEALRLALQ